MIRLLFICMGNICRSPAAEIICRRQVAEAGLSDQVEIDSAGTIRHHAGNPPDPRMAESLKRRGYQVSGRARQIEPADLEHFVGLWDAPPTQAALHALVNRLKK